jgi:Tol biopolymer transport system component
MKQMKSEVLRFIVFFLLVVVTACSGTETIQQPTIVATQGSKFATPTTLKSTTTPSQYVKQCLNVDNDISFGDTHEEILYFDVTTNRYSLYNVLLNTREAINPGLNIVDYIISPNHKLLAYKNIDTNQIRIVNTSRKVISIINEDEGKTLEPIHWLDNEYLVLSKTTNDLINTTVIYSINNKKMVEYLPDYPEINNIDHINWGGYMFTRVAINPKMEYAVYPSIGKKAPIILYDLINKKPVSVLYTDGFFGSMPQWSRDGKEVLVTGYPGRNENGDVPLSDGNELYLLDTAGKVTRLTYLTANQNADETAYSWSPDESKVAFLLETNNLGWHLALYDRFKGIVTDLCLAGYQPMWSVDGRFLLLNSTATDNSIYIVDIENGKFKTFHIDGVGLGWIAQ